ncbi:hypothetical protein FA15DRAFT_14148 [Coprinopsis marcescibilis]|uniref:DNA recombination and repair protein Rad51-like C-terminal domain-containing protein n=1 Tax=Coprinopsis marcescibilis TaxID=230819 RepID=A0A5C3LF56_COPMA|nr:hypothetical protein FA15DRAFT_14148 [Coprinopsis marcescibilis]
MSNPIIDQIHSESLLHLLTSVAGESETGFSTGIHGLDACCRASGIKPHHQVLEIQGSLPLGGWEKAAFLFDVDDTFDIRRFKQILLQRFAHASTTMLPAMVEACLARLCVIRPKTTLELATSLANVPKYLANRFPTIGLGLVAIDSMSAFHWPDRFLAERIGSRKPSMPSINPQRQVVNHLQSIRQSLAPMILVSNWGVLYRQHLDSLTNSSFEGQTGVTNSDFSVDTQITTARGREGWLPEQLELSVQGRQEESFVGYIRTARTLDMDSVVVYRISGNGISF